MSSKIEALQSFKNLLLRLFGNTKISNNTNKTETQWRNILLKILNELDKYASENIETDELHFLMLQSGLASSHEHIKKEKDLEKALLGYIEGIVRFSFSIMGDLPNHSTKKGGRKKKTHYELNRLRELHYAQNSNQKYLTLILAYQGELRLKTDPQKAMRDFRLKYGFQKSIKDFLKWYRIEHSKDYTQVY